MHSSMEQSAGISESQISPSDCQIAKHIAPKNTFLLCQGPVAACFTPLKLMLGIAHGNVGLLQLFSH